MYNIICKTFLKNFENAAKLVWAEILLLLLICFMSYRVHISDLVFWPVFKSEYIEKCVRPANAFICWCFCFGTEVKKNNVMGRFDFYISFRFITCYMPKLKKNVYLFIYLFCNFHFFVSVFKYIVTRKYIIKNILS